MSRLSLILLCVFIIYTYVSNGCNEPFSTYYSVYEMVIKSTIRINPLNENREINFFPNPTSGQFSITMENEMIGKNYVDVTTPDGKIVYKETLAGIKSKTSDLLGQPQAVYIVKAPSNGKVITEFINCIIQKQIIK